MLNNPRCKLVISHEAGDEGFEYQRMLIELAKEEEVDLRFISDRVSEYRHLNLEGRKMYTLWDLYPHADLVTYPSTYEGFGNAFLEALYFKVPIVVNRYSIFIRDIEPKGFRVPMISGFVTGKNVDEVNRVLWDHDYRRECMDYNYDLARRFYSYGAVRHGLRTLIQNLTGLD
jgi:glycosyltransferase involved in cell wall biosynthesis